MELTVQQRTTRQIHINHSMLIPPLFLRTISRTSTRIRHNPYNLANLPILNRLPNLHRNGEKPRPNSLHQENTLALRSLHQNLRLLRVDRERLLAEDMFPRFEREHRVLEMVRVRRRDVDYVDVGVSDEGLVGPVRGAWRGDFESSDEILCLGLGAGGGHSDDGVRHVAGTAEGGVN